MNRVKVVALYSFDHNGNVPRGAVIELQERDALSLAQKGMVDIVRVNSEMKKKEYTSALPADPVLLEKTVSESSSGKKKSKKKSKDA